MLWAALFGAGLAVCPTLWAQGGITEEQGLTVFRTGGSEPLLTLALPMALPDAAAAPVLRLDFGFATDEPELPDSFFDSFSVTLQGTNAAGTALLLTADRTGVVWTPENPGGLALSPADVETMETNYPAWLPTLAIRMAYSLAFALPQALVGQPGTLFLDLFDNLNGAESLAWVGNLRVDGAVRPYRLFSAATLEGPYVEEGAAILDEEAKLFRLPPPGGTRFYRVQADHPTRITAIAVEQGQLTIRFSEAVLRLQSSASPAGPYVDDPRFVWDPNRRRFVGPLPDTQLFFRVNGTQLTVITAIQVEGGQLVVEVAEVTVRLLEATTPTGPYGEAQGYRVNGSLRQVRVVRPAQDRFYRLEANARLRIRRVQALGSELILQF